MSDPKDSAPSASSGRAGSPDLALAEAPLQTSDGLDATLARLEQNSREVQEYLDSIEEKISRMEPRLERLSQPAPTLAPPAEDLPPSAPLSPPPAPPLPHAAPTVADTPQHLETSPANQGPPGQRRRRSDQDEADRRDQPGSRRRLPSAAGGSSFPDDPSSGRLGASFLHLRRSPITWIVGAALILIAVLILVPVSGRHQPSLATLPQPQGPGSTAPQSTPADAAGDPSVTASGSKPKPSALVPAQASNTVSPAPSDPSSPEVATAGSSAATAGTSTPETASDTLSPDTDSAPVPATSTRSSTGKVHVSSGVMAANLLYSRPPQPPGGLARLFHMQGKVTMEVVISRTGRVQNIRFLSGHRLLRGAARDAVSTWRYRPWTVGGIPVDVATIVSVEFRR